MVCGGCLESALELSRGCLYTLLVSGVCLGVLRRVLRSPNQVLAVLSFSKIGHLKEGHCVSGRCLDGALMSMGVVLMISEHINGVWSVSGGSMYGQIV